MEFKQKATLLSRLNKSGGGWDAKNLQEFGFVNEY